MRGWGISSARPPQGLPDRRAGRKAPQRGPHLAPDPAVWQIDDRPTRGDPTAGHRVGSRPKKDPQTCCPRPDLERHQGAAPGAAVRGGPARRRTRARPPRLGRRRAVERRRGRRRGTGAGGEQRPAGTVRRGDPRRRSCTPPRTLSAMPGEWRRCPGRAGITRSDSPRWPAASASLRSGTSDRGGRRRLSRSARASPTPPSCGSCGSWCRCCPGDKPSPAVGATAATGWCWSVPATSRDGSARLPVSPIVAPSPADSASSHSGRVTPLTSREVVPPNDDHDGGRRPRRAVRGHLRRPRPRDVRLLLKLARTLPAVTTYTRGAPTLAGAPLGVQMDRGSGLLRLGQVVGDRVRSRSPCFLPLRRGLASPGRLGRRGFCRGPWRGRWGRPGTRCGPGTARRTRPEVRGVALG